MFPQFSPAPLENPVEGFFSCTEHLGYFLHGVLPSPQDEDLGDERILNVMPKSVIDLFTDHDQASRVTLRSRGHELQLLEVMNRSLLVFHQPVPVDVRELEQALSDEHGVQPGTAFRRPAARPEYLAAELVKRAGDNLVSHPAGIVFPQALNIVHGPRARHALLGAFLEDLHRGDPALDNWQRVAGGFLGEALPGGTLEVRRPKGLHQRILCGPRVSPWVPRSGVDHEHRLYRSLDKEPYLTRCTVASLSTCFAWHQPARSEPSPSMCRIASE